MRASPPRPQARPQPPLPPPPPPLLLLLLLLLFHSAVGSGVFELQILEFSNYRLQLASGACCGGAGGIGGDPCAEPCRTRFTLCLKEYQSAVTAGGCSFGHASSPVLGVDSFTLPEPTASQYVLALPFTFRWTRSFTLILQAHDDYNHTDLAGGNGTLIEEASWSGIVEPSPAWHTLRHAGSAAAVTYRVRVLCQPNYYNTTCTTFCRARDDKFGHYTCQPTGDKRCLSGWQGDNCEIPVCKEGCHPTHGRCDRPGDCDCRPGWRGELCSQCRPYPGCEHGYCNGSSWDCTCDTNWGGILCDQDLNYCGTHEPCRHGGTCENTAPDRYLCTCAEGFSGADCERVDDPCAPRPCAHGACSPSSAPPGYSCACAPGWTGANCDTDVDDCASAPCLHGATCRDLTDAYACECPPGRSGPTCAEDVDECAGPGALGPCANAASCANTPGGYSCACLPGWTGSDCESNVDDCTGQCLNGATCIDLVDDFHCACAPGYAGRTCAVDVDECASRPCRNGGECVDSIDSYRCICPVGYTGADCELTSCFGRYCQDDRDHCAGSPCGNGAPCYSAQSDYYCHCPSGWAGKNCTQRAALCGRLACDENGGGGAVRAQSTCSGEGRCMHGRCVHGRCVCDAGYEGSTCADKIDECASSPCRNNGTCVSSTGGGTSGYTCECRDGWRGDTCDERNAGGDRCPTEGGCRNGGSCVSGADGEWKCACRAGWGGATCEREVGFCASAPCRHGGRCTGGTGRWRCACPPGRAGADCSEPERAPPCGPSPCPTPATCLDSPEGARCLCPPASPRSTRRCLELIGEREEGGESQGEGAGPGECGPGGGTWWWGCNVCWCGTEGEPPACTRLWCGPPDCAGERGRCRPDEVCVPVAGALCLRAPCAAEGVCMRMAGRRVEAPPLPAPLSCWPGQARVGGQCAAAGLELAGERLARGAHVERACRALRRALSAALAPDERSTRTELVLLCDLAADDDHLLEVALWAAEEEPEEAAWVLGESLRALGEAVARRRLARHPLLGAALRLRPHAPLAPTTPAAPASASSGPSGAVLALGALVPLLVLAGAAAAALHLRGRRAAAERARRDEDKTNNLQNEENLRRYANPLRPPEEPRDPHDPRDLPAHLYKPQNADARNNTRLPDKECTKRAPPAPRPPRAPRAPPPERLTVLV